ncbi:hypothetical protein SRIMM317S_00928 [Streptomyces rimosus subsp. rimosus]
MSAQPRVVVVGGGIAGLSAAFRLQEAGCDAVVLESAGPEMIGGRMATVEVSGFAVNRAATILIHSYRELIRLIAAAGLAGEVVPGSTSSGWYARHVPRGARLRTAPRSRAPGGAAPLSPPRRRGPRRGD